MAVTAEILLKTYPKLLQHVDGDIKNTAKAPCSQTNPLLNAIGYVSDEEYLEKLLASDISILIVHEKISGKAKEQNRKHKTLLATKNVYLSMALINARFFPLPFVKVPFERSLIHSTAVVAKTARLGQNVILAPHVVISENVEIGDGTYIGAHSIVEPNSSVGRDSFIHAQVYIGHTCQIGDRVEIKPQSVIGSDGFGYAHDENGHHYRLPHYGAVIIEDDVHIGANVNIDRGTFDPAVIGAGTKIDNHCHFGHNVKVGRNCLITAGLIVAGSSTIGDNCVFAGRVSINGHIEITSNCTIGPMSGVTKDITQPGVYSGFPPIPFRDSLKVTASGVHLPRIRKNLMRVMKHLGLDEDEEKGS